LGTPTQQRRAPLGSLAVWGQVLGKKGKRKKVTKVEAREEKGSKKKEAPNQHVMWFVNEPLERRKI